MTKTFYITYWANKHKKHITRQGKHDINLDLEFLKKVLRIMFIMTWTHMVIEQQIQVGK